MTVGRRATDSYAKGKRFLSDFWWHPAFDQFVAADTGWFPVSVYVEVFD